MERMRKMTKKRIKWKITRKCERKERKEMARRKKNDNNASYRGDSGGSSGVII